MVSSDPETFKLSLTLLIARTEPGLEEGGTGSCCSLSPSFLDVSLLEFPGILMVSIPRNTRLQEIYFILLFADAVNCKVELERAGMFIPEARWERSLPASPAPPIGTVIGISEAAYPSSSGMPVLVCVAQIHKER